MHYSIQNHRQDSGWEYAGLAYWTEVEAVAVAERMSRDAIVRGMVRVWDLAAGRPVATFASGGLRLGPPPPPRCIYCDEPQSPAPNYLTLVELPRRNTLRPKMLGRGSIHQASKDCCSEWPIIYRS